MAGMEREREREREGEREREREGEGEGEGKGEGGRAVWYSMGMRQTGAVWCGMGMRLGPCATSGVWPWSSETCQCHLSLTFCGAIHNRETHCQHLWFNQHLPLCLFTQVLEKPAG